MPESWFVVTRGDQQQGPLDEGQVASLIQSGQVGGESLCWAEGMGDWVPMAQIAQFAPALAAQQPPGAGAAVSEGFSKGMSALKQTLEWTRRTAAKKIESTKIRMRINSAKKVREQWLVKLGEKVYRQSAAAADPQISDEVAAVLRYDQQIADAEQEIAKIEAS